MGDSLKWVKSRRRRKKRERERERRAKVGENNGQATHGARKHAWRTQAAWAKRRREKEEKRRKTTMVITMAKLCMAHASTHGARKHAWRTQAAWAKREKANDGNNNGQLRIATPSRVAHVKPRGPKYFTQS